MNPNHKLRALLSCWRDMCADSGPPHPGTDDVVPPDYMESVKLIRELTIPLDTYSQLQEVGGRIAIHLFELDAHHKANKDANMDLLSSEIQNHITDVGVARANVYVLTTETFIAAAILVTLSPTTEAVAVVNSRSPTVCIQVLSFEMTYMLFESSKWKMILGYESTEPTDDQYEDPGEDME